MGVSCLGQVTIGGARIQELIIKIRGLGDNKDSNRLSSILTYFELGKKRYVPLTHEGKVDNSENRCEVTLECSKEKPRPVGEVVKSITASKDLSISSAMMNRLWLYDSKLYESTRNDYSQE